MAYVATESYDASNEGPSTLIRIRQLRKRFASGMALDGIDLDLGRGESLVVTGANGAGRSTLLAVLATLLKPTSGEVVVGGVDALKDPMGVRCQVSYLEQQPAFHPRLTVGEHLAFVAASRDLAATDAETVLNGTGLAAERPIRGLSPGLRQQLGLAAALLGESPLLLLDEPFSPLDPEARRCFVEALGERRRRGATLVLACNDPDLAAELGDRLIVLDQGRLVGEPCVPS